MIARRVCLDEKSLSLIIPPIAGIKKAQYFGPGSDKLFIQKIQPDGKILLSLAR
jgi:hypothetical protein